MAFSSKTFEILMKRFNYRGVRVATQFLKCKVVVQKGMRSAYIVRSPKDDNVITRKKNGSPSNEKIA